MRPVLQVDLTPEPGAVEDPTEADGAQEATPVGTTVPSADGQFSYTLGPVAIDGSAVARASASQGPATVQVSVDLCPDQRDQANAAFNACFEGADTCPPASGQAQGSMAVVIDDLVVSAPAVNGADLANDTFTITGDFTNAEAKELAAFLNPN